MTSYNFGGGRRYVVGDAVEVLQEHQNEAAAIFLDDAWARPQRAEQFGVEYDTHPFNSQQQVRDYIDTSTTTAEILDACFEALIDGGWLIADADDWLLPRMINYLRSEWGDVAKSYEGGGYRKLGGVTYTASDGTPDRSTAGMYLSTGGYPVVFAHKGETDRRTSESARQITPRVRSEYDWGSIKPVKPYESWIKGLVEPGEQIFVPCAGTAPAALAAERVFENDAQYICIDNEEDAYDAFVERRSDEPSTIKQQTLE